VREAESHEATQGGGEGKGEYIRNPGLLSFPPRTLAANPYEQRFGADHERDPSSNQSGGSLPGRALGLDAVCGQAPSYRWYQVGQKRYLNMDMLKDLELEEEHSLAEAV
jgi:hypothetical protein